MYAARCLLTRETCLHAIAAAPLLPARLPGAATGGAEGGTHDGDGQGNQVAPTPAGERSEPGFFCAAGAKILGF